MLLAGQGDDALAGGQPAPARLRPAPASHDVCNGQQGTDFAVENTCEEENQIEATGPLPED